jgi:NADPH:quinone reductase-like Zn-dependent oxidoreductase
LIRCGIESWKAANGGLKKGGKCFINVGDGGLLFAQILSLLWWLGWFTVKNAEAPEVVVNDMKKIAELVEAGKVKPVLDDRKFELTT